MSNGNIDNRRDNLVVWQYNCNKGKAVMLDLQRQLDSRVVDVLPYTYKGSIRGLSTQYSYYKGEAHDSKGTRVGVVICNNRLITEEVASLRTSLGVCV